MSEVTPETTEVTPAEPAEQKPAVALDDYTGLSLEAHRNAEHGLWEFGVTLSGAYVVLATRRLGRIDDQIREAIQPGFKAARADQYRREVLGQ